MKLDLSKLEHFDRQTEKKYKQSSAAIHLDGNGSRIRLNSAALDLLELKGRNKEMRVKFFRFHKTWFLSITTEADGYSVTLETKHRGGGAIGAVIVLDQMLLNHPDQVDYFLQETDHELAGQKLIELLPKPSEK